MNILLIFFAIPLATIILSAILETFIKCPFKVAGIFFSIFIVIAFALGGTAELVLAAIVYTIISFITAIIVKFIRKRKYNAYNNWDSNICNSCSSWDNGINPVNFNNGFDNNLLSLNNNSVTENPLQEETNNLNANNNRYRRCR